MLFSFLGHTVKIAEIEKDKLFVRVFYPNGVELENFCTTNGAAAFSSATTLIMEENKKNGK